LRALLLPVIVGLPLAAQLNVGIVESDFLRNLRRSSRPYLLVFEDESKPIMPSVRKLLQEDGIADLDLVPRTLPKGSELAVALQRRFAIDPNTRWAVLNSKEQCLVSGRTIPKANDFAQALAAKGVQSPIRVLREFLKTHPDHLDARLELLSLQQKSAERRTRAALGLELEDQPDNSIMIALQGAVAEILDNSKPESIPADKILDTALDLQIWGAYAESLDRMMTGDDWIACGLNFKNNGMLLEVCSPLLKVLYKRKIGQVEAALERAPVSNNIWSVWIRMADVIGNRSIQAVVDSLTQQPGGAFSSWPKSVKKKLIDEARDNGSWNYVADCLWGEYENSPRQSSYFNMGSDGPNSSQDNEVIKYVYDSIWTDEWDTLFGPLLEALVRMNDLGRADAIINALRERQRRGWWSETQMLKAVALAKRCDRPDIAQSWSAYLTENNAVK